MSETQEKQLHKKHRERNLLAKHLKESGLYKLKVIKPKTEYKRKKIKVEDIDKIIDEE